MTVEQRSDLALDVGGANVKLAHSLGPALTRPFALWRQPERLPAILSETARGCPASSRVLLTMTAELCDCFPTKRDGVRAILDAVSEAFPRKPLSVWGLDGSFHLPDEIRAHPDLAASANWHALATVAAMLSADGASLLIDVGSTTTDLIPLSGGRVAASGTNDAERLHTGELVYAGVRRPPLFALADRLPFRGRATRLCAEVFATTLDVYLTLGLIPGDPDDRETADGRPATADAARGRLARMVGADGEGFSETDAQALAAAAHEALLLRLTEAAEAALAPFEVRPTQAVVCGSGEFLAHSLAARVLRHGGRVVGLGDLWGRDASTAACAQALLALAGDPNRGAHR
jgi:probable H4MPT-linked C1 transfer pathway protein